MSKRFVLGTVLLLLASGSAAGSNPILIPEPGILELLSIGAVVAVVAAIRGRRK
jgi:hypothetical protein